MKIITSAARSADKIRRCFGKITQGLAEFKALPDNATVRITAE